MKRSNPYPIRGVRAFKVGEGFDLHAVKGEIDDYVDMLLGRIDPPFDHGVFTLMELAETAHARAREIEMDILDKESEGILLKDSMASKFRTGKLRAFLELSKRTIDLGSRRITYWTEEGG